MKVWDSEAVLEEEAVLLGEPLVVGEAVPLGPLPEAVLEGVEVVEREGWREGDPPPPTPPLAVPVASPPREGDTVGEGVVRKGVVVKVP